jgi:PAS domain-containing protein
MLIDAEQIEDEQTRSLSANASADDELAFDQPMPLDISVDSLALFRVSSAADNLGAVTFINAAASKLTGYHARELQGRDIATIIPEPSRATTPPFRRRTLRRASSG